MKRNNYVETERRNRLLLMVLSATLLSVALVRADNAQVADGISTSLQIVSLYPLQGDETVYLKTEGESETKEQLQIKVSSTRLPEPVSYKGGRKVILSTRPEGKDYQAAAFVELPVSCKQTIIVLAPAPKDSELPYLAVTTNASWSDFKPGTRRIINFSKHAIRGELGAQPFTRGAKKNVTFQCEPHEIVDVPVLDPDARALASHPVILEYRVEQTLEKKDITEESKDGRGSEKTTDDKATPKDDEAPVVAEVPEKKGEEWRVLSSTRWFYTPEQRHLIFALDDENRNATVLHGLSQAEPTK